MKNNRGFSILELIISFTLTMIIAVILFEIIVVMKELYEKSVTKTELINRQNLFTDYIYSDIYNKGLTELSMCGENCINFMYDDGTSKNLFWSFYVDDGNSKQALQSLGYGDYKVNLINNTNFDTDLVLTRNGQNLTGVKICYNNNLDTEKISSYVNIKLPIFNNAFPDEDFGLNILYTYKSGSLTNNIPVSSGC